MPRQSASVSLYCRNQCGRDRQLIFVIADDGSAKLHSPADGVLRITAEEMERFTEQLDLAASSLSFAGGMPELIPTLLIEPLEPVHLADIGKLEKRRRASLRDVDALLCEIYVERKKEGTCDEVTVRTLGEIRRWLYRKAPTSFWWSCDGFPADAVISHATLHLPPVKA